MKKGVILSLLSVLFAVVPCFAGQMGQVRIFTESVGWTDVGTANREAQIILSELRITKDVEILGDNDIGAFAEANTNDGDLDIIIMFGYFPVSLYAPGNSEPDDSVGELFLEGGNMILNTADYIFYVTQGGAANEATGLTNMTDSTFDMWADGNVNGINDEGKNYTPSIPESYDAPRPFKMGQVEANAEWEMEAFFGDNGADNADPAVIHNVDYDGRVAIVFQVSNNAMPRGKVITEMLNNWLSTVVEPDPVEYVGKLSSTWGGIKQNF